MEDGGRESERKYIKSDRLSRFEENEWNEHTKLKCWDTSTGVQKMAQDGEISMNAERMRRRVEKRMSEIIIFWYSKSDFKWMRVYFLWVFLISLYFSMQRRQTKKKTRKRVWQTNCIRGTHKTVSPAQKVCYWNDGRNTREQNMLFEMAVQLTFIRCNLSFISMHK